MALTGKDQRVKRMYEYGDAWGTITGGVHSVGFTGRDRARFKGASWFGDLGPDVCHMRNRWYSPTEGRFWSEDPIGLEGGINPYTFAGSDPVNGSDPTGLTQWVCTYSRTVTDTDGQISYGAWTLDGCSPGGGGGWPYSWRSYLPLGNGGQTPRGPGGSSGRGVRGEPPPEQRVQRPGPTAASARGGMECRLKCDEL